MAGIISPANRAAQLPSSSFPRFLGIFAVLFLAACSSSPSSPSSSSSGSSAAPAAAALAGLPEPCSLITQAEVESALGKGASMHGLYNQRIDMNECILKPATAGAIEEIVVVVHKADMWDGVKKAMLPPSSDAKAGHRARR
ncbi:MAG: hypothetical protein WA738_02500 [Candidatus Angelobacter sp.]